MKKLYIDIETRSRVALTKFGVYQYVRCPDFRILMASYRPNWLDVDVQTALTEDEMWDIPGLWDPKVLKVAHNAPFERVCFSTLNGMPPGEYLAPEHWHDTQAVAAEYGYPKELGLLAKALRISEKDTAGTRLINLFSKPVPTGKRKGQWNGPDTHPLEFLDFIDYCEQDVVVLEEVDEFLGDFPTESERQVYMADQRVNDRGILIDMKLARSAIKAANDNQIAQKTRVVELTTQMGNPLENPNSIPQMSKWLRKEGLKAPNLRAESVEALLAQDLTPEQREVLELRQELALVASKKFSHAVQMQVGGRLRGTLKFFGAHTGRWSGSGTQVQNLPRHSLKPTPEAQETAEMMRDCGVDEEVIEGFLIEDQIKVVDRAVEALLLTESTSAEDLKALVRPMFIVDGSVVDYASIEARVIAALAGEEWALEAFREGRDIYVETAARMGGLTRSQGKIAVLALGFGGSYGSLKAMAGPRDEYKGRLILDMPDELVKKALVDPWRKANPNIVRLWYELEAAFGEGGKVGDMLEVEIDEDPMGRFVKIHLPSGRIIGYHGVRYETYYKEDPSRPGRKVKKTGWRFADPKNPFNRNMRIETYGGRLAENVTQAVARDIWANGLVNLESAGHTVVGHVHDEALVEGSHDVDEIRRLMCKTPKWAKKIPVDGEGFNCYRYRKG